MNRLFLPLAAAVLAAGLAAPALPANPPEGVREIIDADGFRTFLSPEDLRRLQANRPSLIVVDARSADEYAAGHVPGAVNLPGEELRTPSAKPGEGDSQYLFRTADGSINVGRYEELLGDAGVSRDADVVIYGNHAGKSDGTVAAMILDGLGHDGEILFLDGVGLTEWQSAGFDVSTTARTLPPAEYVAQPRPGFLWTLDDVKQAVQQSGSAVFYDTRSADEFIGADLRDNKRGGHIPGAVSADYAELLTADKTVRSREEVEAIFAEHGLPEARAAGRPIVLYCQTSTRVSLPYLLLRELGYENVHVYDASWHEYGNRDDTPVETAAAPATRPAAG